MGCQHNKGITTSRQKCQASTTVQTAVVDPAEISAERTQCGPKLKSPEGITHWPEFPKGTTSLTSKHLT